MEGTITYGGGPWPGPGTLYFTPVDTANQQPIRPGWANFDTQGKFHATTLKEGDGLLPGQYLVALETFTTPWKMGEPKPKTLAPERFERPPTSGLTVTVMSKQRKVTVQWDVPKP